MKNSGKIRMMIKLACILLGNGLIAFGGVAFAIPHAMALVGVNSVARNLNHYFGIDMATAITCINMVTFLFGFWMLGKEFAGNTILSTIAYPFLFRWFSKIECLKTLTDDRFLATILAGVCFGTGMGIIMRVGGSSGGMDIPPLIMKAKRRWPVVWTMNGIEAVGLLFQTIYSDSNQMLYGIVSVLVTGVVLNQILLYGEENIQVMIISGEYKKINRLIQEKLCRGSTLIPVETGYLHVAQKAVLCVLSARELGQLKQEVEGVDDKAFVVVTSAREVKGIGFTVEKQGL